MESTAEAKVLAPTPPTPAAPAAKTAAPTRSAIGSVTIRMLLALGLFSAVALIVGANFNRDLAAFSFKWKLTREVPVEIRLELAKPSTIVHSIEAPGDVEADVEVEISSQVVSKIVELPVREGDRVAKGDLLVRLDAADFDAQVRSAEARLTRLKAMLESAVADLAKSNRDLELNQRLLKSKAVGSSAVADFITLLSKDKARIAMTNAEMVEAEAMLVKSKEDLADTVLRSPIDGVVSQLVAEVGETVITGTPNNPGTVIMTISDLASMVVRARVDETDVPLIKPGQKTIIRIQSGVELVMTGKVLRIAPKGTKGGGGKKLIASSVTSNPNDVAIFETIISIDHPPPSVRLGMSANVEIQVEEHRNVLSAPSQAVLHRKPRDLPPALFAQLEREAQEQGTSAESSQRYRQVVFVEKDGRATCRLVKTGISDDSRVEILSGLEAGDRVIAGPYRVFDKMKEGRAVALIREDIDTGENVTPKSPSKPSNDATTAKPNAVVAEPKPTSANPSTSARNIGSSASTKSASSPGPAKADQR